MKAVFALTASLVFAAVFPPSAFAGTPADDRAAMKQLCATAPCRGKTHVTLRLGDGKVYDREFSEFNPVVMGNDITVLPGETLYIEAEEHDGRLQNLKPVMTLHDPARTLVIKFKQEEAGVNMVLKVFNPFPRHLKYSLGMLVPGQDSAIQTSSCPAIPNGPVFEQWPHPIFQLVIRNPILLSRENPDLECKF